MVIILDCDDVLLMSDVLRAVDFARVELGKKRSRQDPGAHWISVEGFRGELERQERMEYWEHVIDQLQVRKAG